VVGVPASRQHSFGFHRPSAKHVYINTGGMMMNVRGSEEEDAAYRSVLA